MKKAYAYKRVSTQVQTEKFGLEVQQNEIIEYAKANDIEIVDWFVDEGITGKTADRNGLQDMFVALKENPDVKNVITLNCTRLWRSDIAGGLIRYELSKLNVDIISVHEPTYSLYTQDASDYLMNQIFQALATYDRMQINQKLKMGRIVKASKGNKACGSVPFGYKWENAEVVVDFNNNLIVNDIYCKYIDFNYSLKKLYEYCIMMGYKSSSGKEFSKPALLKILSNDFYIGIVTHAGKKVKGNHVAIIDQETFDRVQQKK